MGHSISKWLTSFVSNDFLFPSTYCLKIDI